MLPVVEEISAEKKIDLDMDKAERVDLDMGEVEVEEAVEASVVAVAGCGGGRGGRCNHNSYNNNRRHNNNHEVNTSDVMGNFTPEEVSVLIQANVWDNICDEQRANRRRLNNNDDDGDITERVNALV